MIMKKLSSLAAATLMSVAFVSTAQAQTVGIGTMPQGTVSYSSGSVLARVLATEMGMQARVQPNAGETTLLPLVNSGEYDFGIANVLESYEAYTGSGTFNNRPQPNLRIAAAMFPLRTAMFVRADSDIHTLADLAGKRITFGFSAMGSISVVLEALLANGGLSGSDIRPVMVPNVVAGADALQNGRADAFFFAVGAAKPSEVHAVIPLRVLPMSEDPADIARMQAIFPDGYISTVPPSPAFAGVNVPTPVLSYDNMLVTNDRVSDEIIFTVLDAIANNKEALAAGVALFGGMNPDALYKDSIITPYHPAAREWQQRRAAAQ
jgi:TRAP transporter TAXI family solute receptor